MQLTDFEETEEEGSGDDEVTNFAGSWYQETAEPFKTPGVTVRDND